MGIPVSAVPKISVPDAGLPPALPQPNPSASGTFRFDRASRIGGNDNICFILLATGSDELTFANIVDPDNLIDTVATGTTRAVRMLRAGRARITFTLSSTGNPPLTQVALHSKSPLITQNNIVNNTGTITTTLNVEVNELIEFGTCVGNATRSTWSLNGTFNVEYLS